MWYVFVLNNNNKTNELLIDDTIWVDLKNITIVREACHKRSSILRSHSYNMSRIARSSAMESIESMSGAEAMGMTTAWHRAAFCDKTL